VRTILVVSLGRRQYKYILSIVFLLILICPTASAVIAHDAVSPFQPSHFADNMPAANQTLLLKDSSERSVLRITCEYDFSKGWTNGIERTGLILGFGAPSLGSWVSRIDFETMTYRWWAYYSGGKEYDYELNYTLYFSNSIGGWYNGGSGSYEIEESDLVSLRYIGGSMTFVNFTVHTLFGSVLYDEDPLTVGVNFTKQEDGWAISTFSNISSVFTDDDPAVEYVMNTQLPIPQWFGILPYAFGLGAIVLVIVILRIVVIEVRRLDSP